MTEHEDLIVAVEDLLNCPPRMSADPEAASGAQEPFDLNSLIDMLQHLELETGYTLGFYHRTDLGASYPVVYARKISAEPPTSYEGVQELPEDQIGFPFHVLSDGTTDGFFELAVFGVMGRQFMLGWHANYSVCRIVAGQYTLSRCNDLLRRMFRFHKEIPKSTMDDVREWDLTPVVRLTSDTASVRLVIFSPWGGFKLSTIELSVEPPHKVVSHDREDIASYSCGVMY